MTKSRAPKSEKPADKRSSSGGSSGLNVEGVDRIRDILFGEHIVDYDGRFQQVEDAIDRLGLEIRKEMEKNLASVKRQVETHVSKLSDLLKQERESRSETVGDLDKKHRLQSETLQKEIQSRFKEITALLEQRLDALTLNKVDRKSMAVLLNELASRLSEGSQDEGAS